ncbi:MAG: hypothetical protein JO129_02330 [Candidatus Dependentiae bacterium]|nr:hypothetical protein [Candidatus Dependentiae bacterium]
MKNLYVSVAIITLACLSTSDFVAAQQTSCRQEPLGANPYTWAPQQFTAKDKSTGNYWVGNKKYPGKAYVGEIEYTQVVAIKKCNLRTAENKKLKRNKIYLGFYIDTATKQQYYLYGIKSTPDKVNEEPDSDVLVQIEIAKDYGPGE